MLFYRAEKKREEDRLHQELACFQIKKFEQAASLIDMDLLLLLQHQIQRYWCQKKILVKVIHCYQHRQHPDLNQNNTSIWFI